VRLPKRFEHGAVKDSIQYRDENSWEPTSQSFRPPIRMMELIVTKNLKVLDMRKAFRVKEI
jgi:hypothetical protein